MAAAQPFADFVAHVSEAAAAAYELLLKCAPPVLAAGTMPQASLSHFAWGRGLWAMRLLLSAESAGLLGRSEMRGMTGDGAAVGPVVSIASLSSFMYRQHACLCRLPSAHNIFLKGCGLPRCSWHLKASVPGKG